MRFVKVISFLPVLAGDAGGSSSVDVTSIMSGAVSDVQSQLLSILAVVVPAIVVIVGATVAVKYGISWFKKMKG